MVGVIFAEPGGSLGFRFQLVGIVGLVVSGLLSAWAGYAHNIRRGIRAWITVAMMAVLPLGVIRGHLAGAPFEILIFSAMPYLLVLVVLIDWCDANLIRRVVHVFRVHAVVGGCFVAVLVLARGSELGRAFVNNETGASLALLYSWPVLLLRWSDESAVGRVGALLGMFIQASVAVVSETRSVAMAVLVFFGAFLHNGRQLNFIGRVGGVFRFSLLVLCVIFAVWSGIARDLLDASEGLFGRTEAIWADESYFEREGRVQEVETILPSFSISEWLVGRGIAVPWSNPRLYNGEPRYMVHVGYLQLIYQGGLLNLLAYLVGPILAGLIACVRWWRGELVGFTGVSAILVLNYALETTHYGGMRTSLGFVMFTMAAGVLARKGGARVCQ